MSESAVEQPREHEAPFAILATAARAVDQNRVLKHGETFAVLDRHGDVLAVASQEQGLYHEGTRYVSQTSVTVGDLRPFLLGSTVKDTNDVLVVDLTNPDLPLLEGARLPRGTLHFARSKFLWDGACYERWRITNHGRDVVRVPLQFRFDADFADVFEVRGTTRAARGRRLAPEVRGSQVLLHYEGLDRVRRTAAFHFAPAPAELGGDRARFDLDLAPGASTTLRLTVACSAGHLPAERVPYEEAFAAFTHWRSRAVPRRCRIRASNEQFNDWVNRSTSDLEMMITETEHGLYPYAGVPWFSTPFGRDGIITALQMLWLEPRIARGVLSYLAAHQADAVLPEQDAEPGKILHETRGGEMAALGEVPFGCYYGSVDATPLFVMLAGAYWERTADRGFLEAIWPNVERALDWLDRYGDADGDGFVEFSRRSRDGLVQQGWKDSFDSVFHADGTLVEGPVALCEVQGYAFAARLAAAKMARVLGHDERGAVLERSAERTRAHFEEAFWADDLGYYVIALDGAKQPCRVRASNAGHCLFSGIVAPDRAERVGRALLAPDFFTGWGIRTLAANEPRFNPMSYHNGSIWPHDNAIIAAGLSRYGLGESAVDVLNALFDASLFVDLHRMPELYCGFRRRSGRGPTLYPVACAPQAWAAGSVFMLLQAALGLSVDAEASRIVFRRPRLPVSLQNVTIRGLHVNDAVIDLSLERHSHNVGIDVLHKSGDVDVVTLT